MKYLSLILFFFLIICSNSFSQNSSLAKNQALLKKISQSNKWHRIMHYRKRWIGGYKSELDGIGFFMDSNGKYDPLAELKASLRVLMESEEKFGMDPKNRDYFRCQFPYRSQFLIEKFKLAPKKRECKMLNDLLSEINPESISLVYATNFATNPASYFGHTFFRFNAKPDVITKEHNSYLDYTLGYVAQMGKDPHPLAFATLGMMGGYRGVFEVNPYHIKVHEYAGLDGRDMWEYKLKLTETQSVDILKHVWELGQNSYFNYFFFDENCAYQLLTLIESVDENINVSQGFIYVIPSEIVKTVADAGLVENVKFIPSARNQYLGMHYSLNESQKDEVQQIISTVQAAPLPKDPMVLDAAISYLSYKRFKKSHKLPPKEETHYQKMLAERAKLPITKASAFAPRINATRADLSHDAMALEFSTGLAKNEPFIEASFKPALHDYLNIDTGFNKNSQIDFFRLSLRYYKDQKKLDMDEFLLVMLGTKVPVTDIEYPLSWEAGTLIKTMKDLNCGLCKSLSGRLSIGLTFANLSESLMVSFLGRTYVDTNKRFKRNFRFGPIAAIELMYNPIASFKSHLVGEFVGDVLQNQRASQYYKIQWNNAYTFNRSYDARIYLTQYIKSERESIEAKLAMNYYF